MHFLILLISLFSLPLRASESFLPNNLDCFSDAKLSEVQEFSLRKINTLSPSMSVDGKWLETSLSGPHLTLSFSNKSDSTFKVQFTKEDLRNLKLGQISQVLGTLSYWEASTDLMENLTITCKLSQID